MNRREGFEPYDGPDRRKGERRIMPVEDYSGPERRVEMPLQRRLDTLADIDRLLAPKAPWQPAPKVRLRDLIGGRR